jgi:predicted ferric reductase
MTDELLRRPPPRSLSRRPGLYWALFAGNAILILVMWWTTTGSAPVRSAADVFNATGRVTGLLGTYLVLWQLVLFARLPRLQEAVGMQRLALLHRWNGYLSIGLLLAHAVLQTLGYQLAARTDAIHQMIDFARTYDGLLTAMVALALMLLIAGISVVIVRRHLAYQTWYFVHLYTYIAIALAFSHELADGADLIGSRAFTVYWYVLYVLVGGVLLWCRLLQPLVRYSRHRFRVQRVVREAPNVVSIHVTGRDLAGFQVRAGQFLLWRFLDRRRWWEAHPFSISRLPDGRSLRLTVKSSGDFTARVSTIRPGTPVLVEGPFGDFTADRCLRPKALLVGGGIGITPIRALAEDLTARGVDVMLLHRCRAPRDAVFGRELERAVGSTGLRFRHLTNKEAPGGSGRNWFHPQVLHDMVPDIREREVYVCGPRSMARDVLRSLAALAVSSRQVHTEAFRWLP